MMTIEQVNQMILDHDQDKPILIADDLHGKKHKRNAAKWRKQYNKLQNIKTIVSLPNAEKVMKRVQEESIKKMGVIDGRWEEASKVYIRKSNDLKKGKQEHHGGYGYNNLKKKLDEVNFILNA
jgi:ribosome biogenesis protein Tsr3